MNEHVFKPPLYDTVDRADALGDAVKAAGCRLLTPPHVRAFLDSSVLSRSRTCRDLGAVVWLNGRMTKRGCVNECTDDQTRVCE